MKLLAPKDNVAAVKAQIVAEYAGVKLELAEPAGADFQKKSPLGKFPVLDTGCTAVYEPIAILRHIARLAPATNLFGRSFSEATQVDQWVEFGVTDVECPGQIWVQMVRGQLKADNKSLAPAKEDVKKAAKVVDDHLRLKTFLVGQRITLADIALACDFIPLFKTVLDEKFREAHPHITRWFTTIVNQALFRQIVPHVALVEKELGAGEAKEAKAAAPAEKKASPKKQASPKKSPKKAEEPAAGSPKKAAKEVSEQDAWAKKECKMELDPMKKLFSNNPIDVALAKFYEDFEPEVYSVYECQYNYNDENTVKFMTCNLVGGWIQRCDPIRKYAFGCVNICSAEKPFKLNGVWVFKYKDNSTMMSMISDAEYYTWKRLNPAKEADQKRIAELFGGETVDGAEVIERRFFK